MNNMVTFLEEKLYLAYPFIRIFLGFALAVRGIILIMNPDLISQLVSEEKIYFGYAYVAIVHLIGGTLLAFGLLTRISAFFQIPTLIGAIFMVHKGEGLMTAGQSLELEVLVLFLLIVLVIFGSGPLSLDYLLFKKRSLNA